MAAATSHLPDKLGPHMGQLVEYMLATNTHADTGVALAAAEFWTAYLERSLDPGLLRPSLPRLIPILLKNMVRGWGCGQMRVGVGSGAWQVRQLSRVRQPGALWWAVHAGWGGWLRLLSRYKAWAARWVRGPGRQLTHAGALGRVLASYVRAGCGAGV